MFFCGYFILNIVLLFELFMKVIVIILLFFILVLRGVNFLCLLVFSFFYFFVGFIGMFSIVYVMLVFLGIEVVFGGFKVVVRFLG